VLLLAFTQFLRTLSCARTAATSKANCFLCTQGRILLRAGLAVLFVNCALSAGYIVMASVKGQPWLSVVIRLNLRVLLLMVLTFWITPRIDFKRAMGFSPSLAFLVVLATSQIRRLSRIAADYRLAQRSRCPVRPRLRDRYRGAYRQATALLERSNARSTELVQGMESRGFFDDRA